MTLMIHGLIEILLQSLKKIGTWTTKGGFSFAILESGEIIWLSERDGFKHIYRSRPDGRFLKPDYER